MLHPLFVAKSSRSLVFNNNWGVSAKTPTAGVRVEVVEVVATMLVRAATWVWSVAMRAWSWAVVGVAAAMAAWFWVVATILRRLERLREPCETRNLGGRTKNCWLWGMRQFDGGGNKKAQEIAGIWWRRRICTDLQEFDGGGEQSLTWTCRSLTEAANSHWLGLAGIWRWERQIGTDLDRNSTMEAANRHCLEKLAQRKRVIFWRGNSYWTK